MPVYNLPQNIITISFNLNGGTGKFQTIKFEKKMFYTIPRTPIPYLLGYKFSGWADEKKTYYPGTNYRTGTENVILTAQWTPLFYKITYNNGGATGTVLRQENLIIGSKFTIANVCRLRAPSKTSFTGWKDNSGIIYQPGSTYTVQSSNIILTAQWTPIVIYTVTYNAGTDSGIVPSLSVVSGSIITLPNNLTLNAPEGKTFSYWLVETNCYKPGDTYTVTGNVTFTAYWDFSNVFEKKPLSL